MTTDLTELINRADRSDPAAADELFGLLYAELHRLADSQLRRGGALTLGTTTLLREAWLSISGRPGLRFPDRSRFFAYAARAMRGLVIDYSRRRRAARRGRDFEITLTDDAVAAPLPAEELDSVGAAVSELEALDPRLAELVDLHFFAGLTFGEIATLRDVSERTVQRDWRKARLLLHQTLDTDAAPDATDSG